MEFPAEIWGSSRTLICDLDHDTYCSLMGEIDDPGQFTNTLFHESGHVSVYHTTTYGALLMWMEINLFQASTPFLRIFTNLRQTPLIVLTRDGTVAKFRKRLVNSALNLPNISWGKRLMMPLFKSYLHFAMYPAVRDLWLSQQCLLYLRGDLPSNRLPLIKRSFLKITGSTRRLYPKNLRPYAQISSHLATATEPVKGAAIFGGPNESLTAIRMPKIFAFAGNASWHDWKSATRAYPQYYDPNWTSPRIIWDKDTIPLTGLSLTEALGFLTELLAHIVQDLPVIDYSSKYDDSYYVAVIDYINSTIGLPKMADIDMSQLTYEGFWKQFSLAIALLYSALSIPLLPHVNTANEYRGPNFWSMSPLDIHPGWRLVTYVHHVADSKICDSLVRNFNGTVKELVGLCEEVAQMVPREHGHAPPAALWFAWMATPFPKCVSERFRYPSYWDDSIKLTDSENIKSLMHPIPAMLGLSRESQNIRHVLLRDQVLHKNIEDDVARADLLIEGILRRHFFIDLNEHSPLEEQIVNALEIPHKSGQRPSK